jgi:hypothetical protein
VGFYVEPAASTRFIATFHPDPSCNRETVSFIFLGTLLSRFETAGHVLLFSGWNKCEKSPLIPDSRRQHSCLSSAAGTNMKTRTPADREGASRQSIMFVTLYAGFTQGFGVVQASRENLRATQILQHYSEIIRLYTWEQLTNGSIPTSKTWTFYPLGATGGQGVTYTGTLTLGAGAIPEDYGAAMKTVDFTLTWT